MSSPKKFFHDTLKKAGIEINGPRDFDIQVHNERLPSMVLKSPSLGLAEAYMNGWWDCNNLENFFYNLFISEIKEEILQPWKDPKLLLQYLQARLTNACNPQKAFEVGKIHYDLGNDFYRLMLGPTMNYSCGYFKGINNLDDLDEAQIAKMDLICQKLQLKPGMKILEIGCGWGALAKYMAENYNVSVIGLTISKEQADYARSLCKSLPVEIILCDYRSQKLQPHWHTFDRAVSVGMFEHVGYKNYETYMKTVRKFLKNESLFLLHTIGGNKNRKTTDPFIHKYIFPNSMLPSQKQIVRASQKNDLVMEDWHNFGHYYFITLINWYENFTAKWEEIQNLGDQFNNRFYRMWTYYLLSCAALFRSRKAHLWQIVYSPHGADGGYERP